MHLTTHFVMMVASIVITRHHRVLRMSKAYIPTPVLIRATSVAIRATAVAIRATAVAIRAIAVAIRATAVVAMSSVELF